VNSDAINIEDYIGKGGFVMDKPLVNIEEVKYHPMSNASCNVIKAYMPRLEELALRGFHSFAVRTAGKGKKPSISYLPAGVPSIWEELLALSWSWSVDQIKEEFRGDWGAIWEYKYNWKVEEIRDEWIEQTKYANKVVLMAKTKGWVRE
jgi:hypothetical protein